MALIYRSLNIQLFSISPSMANSSSKSFNFSEENEVMFEIQYAILSTI